MEMDSEGDKVSGGHARWPKCSYLTDVVIIVLLLLRGRKFPTLAPPFSCLSSTAVQEVVLMLAHTHASATHAHTHWNRHTRSAAAAAGAAYVKTATRGSNGRAQLSLWLFLSLSVFFILCVYLLLGWWLPLLVGLSNAEFVRFNFDFFGGSAKRLTEKKPMFPDTEKQKSVDLRRLFLDQRVDI